MRITGGEAKGRTLRFPSGSRERPTSDFLRETLFNLLGSLEDKRFLDLYAGSGSVGLEAASRGAKEVCFVEKDVKLAAVIQQNIQSCLFEEKCFVISKDIKKGLKDLFKKEYKIDITFADPPYNRDLVQATLDLLSQYQIPNSLLVIQHSIKEIFKENAGRIYMADQRKYGDNVLTFFKWRNNNAG